MVFHDRPVCARAIKNDAAVALEGGVQLKGAMSVASRQSGRANPSESSDYFYPFYGAELAMNTQKCNNNNNNNNKLYLYSTINTRCSSKCFNSLARKITDSIHFSSMVFTRGSSLGALSTVPVAWCCWLTPVVAWSCWPMPVVLLELHP